MSKPKPSNAARLLGQLRWAGTTQEQRIAHAKMMSAASRRPKIAAPTETESRNPEEEVDQQRAG